MAIGHIGERIRAAREAAGWSRRRLAHTLGVEAETVATWERGTSTPRAATVARAAALLGVRFTDLANDDADRNG